jgi:hypothetical protein
MSEAERYAAAVLEAARSAHDPSAADQQRVHDALSAALVAAPMAGTASVGQVGAGSVTASGDVAAVSTLKLTVAATLIGAAGFAGGFWSRPMIVQQEGQPATTTSTSKVQPRAPRPKSGQPARPALPQASATAPLAGQARSDALSPADSSDRAPTSVKSSGRFRLSLGEEAAALKRAQLTIDADPRRALGLLDDLKRDHPGGALQEEVRVARILALCALGRAQIAKNEARDFLRLYPSSVHIPRVRASCALSTQASEHAGTKDGTMQETDPPLSRQ